MTDKLIEALEPCPFCGAQPEDQDVGDYFVTCPSCGVDGPAGLQDGTAHARKAWNQRAHRSQQEPASLDAKGVGELIFHDDGSADAERRAGTIGYIEVTSPAPSESEYLENLLVLAKIQSRRKECNEYIEEALKFIRDNK